MFPTTPRRYPSQVTKLLLPSETVVLLTRKHPASIAGPVSLAAASFLLVLVLSATVARSSGPGLTALWVAWFAAFAWALWKYANWYRTYFIVTTNRLLLKTRVFRTRVGMLPLGKLQELRFDQSVLGRMLNFSDFIFETAGEGQLLRSVEDVPFASQMYQELMSLLFEPQDEDDGEPPEDAPPGDEPGD
jgi:uncharacterized membrane protein YdbT with pleckstrin-like domain